MILSHLLFHHLYVHQISSYLFMHNPIGSFLGKMIDHVLLECYPGIWVLGGIMGDSKLAPCNNCILLHPSFLSLAIHAKRNLVLRSYNWYDHVSFPLYLETSEVPGISLNKLIIVYIFQVYKMFVFLEREGKNILTDFLQLSFQKRKEKN